MPRHPTACPRKLDVKITHHGRSQAVSRGITAEQIADTVKNGREVATESLGQKGGYISKFYKTFVSIVDGHPHSKTVVAVCESFADRYVLVTCYQEKLKNKP